MGDFLGSYYFHENESCNSKLMALLEVEQPVSIVEMDRVEILKGYRVNRERLEQLDMLFIQDGHTNDTEFDRNIEQQNNSEIHRTVCVENKKEDFELLSLRDFGKRLTGSTDDEVDMLDIPVAPMSLLDSTICSMTTVPLSDVLNSREGKMLQSTCTQCGAVRCECHTVQLLTSPLSSSNTTSNIVSSMTECDAVRSVPKRTVTVAQKLAHIGFSKRSLLKMFRTKAMANTTKSKT